MPESGQRPRQRRKGHSSCDFCKVRKLRCDRPLPCTSCRSRGKTCHFDGTQTATAAPSNHDRSKSTAPVTTCFDMSENPQNQQVHVQLSPRLPFQNPPTLATTTLLSSPQPPIQESLLAEIQALKQLARQLEKRVIQQSMPGHRQSDVGTSLSPSSTINNIEILTPSDTGKVSEVVDHLQRVSMGQSSLGPIYADDVIFKVESIRNIPQAPTYTSQLGKATPCVWLPCHAEARVLVGSYIQDLSYIQHVVHHPSLPAIVDEAYRQIDGHEPVKPGHIILLLSIIACVTHVWAPREGVDSDYSLFLSSAQANAQTPLWIKATYTVLNAAQDSSKPTLETIQGMVILSFIVSNFEGVSMRYRSLISTALLMGRELNIHRIDQELDGTAKNSLQIEMRRRVWWYLVATDWLLAARYGGPGEGVYQTHPLHMTVNKPRNLNDVDLNESDFQLEQPASQPTDMSYFLQRLRLAETSRSIVDHNLMSAASLGRPSHYAHVMAMDFELDQQINQMPSFFQLVNYENTSGTTRASSIFIQAYMLNSLMHTQRCKLHITYLTSEPNNNPAHAASRNTCLQSARNIIRAELQLLRSQHPFVRVRLRLAAILYSVFMASIVLLMDVCINRPTSLQDEIMDGDVAEALRILEDARSHSLAAAKLFESLMQTLARHCDQHQQHSLSQRLSTLQESSTFRRSSVSPENADTTYMHQIQNPSTFSASQTSAPRGDLDRGNPSDALTDQMSTTRNLLAQNLDENTYFDTAEWNGLFSDVFSSSFF